MMDLAIVGGGPAGAATAIEARRRGLRVSLWEREQFPRDKVCGEFISAESIPFLQEIIPAALARSAAIGRAEFISARRRVEAFRLPQAGIGLSRLALDEALWRAAVRAGVECREGFAVRRVNRCGAFDGRQPTWRIEDESGKWEEACALVMACGRWWFVEGFPSPAEDVRNGRKVPWLGAKAHFSDVARREAVEMYFFPGGYCGLAPIEDGLYNACCLVHQSLVRDLKANRIANFADWLAGIARHSALVDRLRGATQVSPTVATAPVLLARRRATCAEAFLVGDAAGFLDPFTGEGISIALQSGRLAAALLAAARRKGDENFARAAELYRIRLGQAVKRSYAVARLVRATVRAPAGIQAATAAGLSWLGGRLLKETRWRETPPEGGPPNVGAIHESPLRAPRAAGKDGRV